MPLSVDCIEHDIMITESLAKKVARQVAAAYGVVEVLGVMRRKHLVAFYDAYARSVVEWSVAAWGLVSANAFYKISVVETQARHFALGGGSTGICREGLAALWGGHDRRSSLHHTSGTDGVAACGEYRALRCASDRSEDDLGATGDPAASSAQAVLCASGGGSVSDTLHCLADGADHAVRVEDYGAPRSYPSDSTRRQAH